MKPPHWNDAILHLSNTDKTLARIIKTYKGETLTSKGDAFFTLLRSITGQQISVKAADSIFAKLTALSPLFPKPILEINDEAFRACGYSAKKVEYIRALARAIIDKTLDLEHLETLDDSAAIAYLSRLPGIGKWTAEMFLIFYSHRPDLFPIDDIGLQKALIKHFNLPTPISRSAMLELAKPWQPYRSVATWYLWRSLDPVPVEY